MELEIWVMQKKDRVYYYCNYLCVDEENNINLLFDLSEHFSLVQLPSLTNKQKYFFNNCYCLISLKAFSYIDLDLVYNILKIFDDFFSFIERLNKSLQFSSFCGRYNLINWLLYYGYHCCKISHLHRFKVSLHFSPIFGMNQESFNHM